MSDIDELAAALSRPTNFCIAFTKLVIAWNLAEDSARDILRAVSGSGLGMAAAVTHMGNKSLIEAIHTVVNFFDDPNHPNLKEAAGHMKHFLSGFETLLSYRNFYVHSIKSLNFDKGGVWTGWLRSTEAKRKYCFISHILTQAELDKTLEEIHSLAEYGQQVVNHLKPKNKLTTLAQIGATELPTLPHKPTWPKTLTKKKDYLR